MEWYKFRETVYASESLVKTANSIASCNLCFYDFFAYLSRMQTSEPIVFLFFLISISCFFNTAHADAVILRNLDGTVREITQREARTACPPSTHLPTIRELAQESEVRGARGILKVNQVKPNNIPAGYDMIDSINPNGLADIFYYNAIGYQPPNDDSGKYGFWTSSEVIGMGGIFYTMNGLSGEDGGNPPGFWRRAVKCLADLNR